MKHISDDVTLFSTLKAELFTAVLGDVLDDMGFLRNFLPPSIRPLRQDAVLVGRAMTVQEADCAGPSEARGSLHLHRILSNLRVVGRTHEHQGQSIGSCGSDP
ncbi:MAG: putative demethylmenaquinone methyltransferase [Spirochaetes bacterium]|nr:MAG: putative demethylmenaquinone methyltransferase [Spirochaetota bacterium]